MKAQMTTPTVPAGLSDRSKGLWIEITRTRAKSPGRLALLQVALEALDRADEASRLLAEQGLLVKTKTTGAVHLNPLAKLERESRQLFVRCWAALRLEWDGRVDGHR